MMPSKVADPIYSALLARLAGDLSAVRRVALADPHRSARDFSVFRFCRTDEIGLSEILGWLLDPRESHAQGAAFLQAFIEQFNISGVELASLPHSRMFLESRTDTISWSNRRLDIEVACGSFLIGIENKPYAAFQPRQIADYCEHLGRKAGDQFAMVILKGWSGKSPREQVASIDLARCQVIDSDYSAVVRWLNTCADLCAAPHVRDFIGSFASFIDKEIVSGMSGEEEELIVQTLKVDQEQLLAALDLIAAAPAINAMLHKQLLQHVAAEAPAKWIITDNPRPRERKTSSDTYYLTIDFDPTFPALMAVDMFDGVLHANFAVRERVQERPPRRKLSAIAHALQTALPGHSGPEKTWLWWADTHSLVEEERISLPDQNIWKCVAQVSELAGAIVKMGHTFEAVIAEALGD